MSSHRHAMQARLDGQVAALRGASHSANPHDLGTENSRAWWKGFREVTDPWKKAVS